jgi:hypothetical protein
MENNFRSCSTAEVLETAIINNVFKGAIYATLLLRLKKESIVPLPCRFIRFN